jgi:hypothetical protein
MDAAVTVSQTSTLELTPARQYKKKRPLSFTAEEAATSLASWSG